MARFENKDGANEPEQGVQAPDRKVTTNLAKDLEAVYQQLKRWGDYLLGAFGWKVVVTGDPNIKTAAADFESKTLYFSLNMEKLISDPNKEKKRRKRLFVYAHELMHFAQALEDPDAYLQTFQTAKTKSQEYADNYNVPVRSIERTFNHFFNIFLDIHDNSMVIHRNTTLQNQGRRHSVIDLYQQLFPESDLTARPLNEQFMYAIIMQIMEPERTVKTSPKVANFLNSPFNYLGRNYSSFLEFIREKVFAPTDSFTMVMSRINHAIMPIFEDFLRQDLEDGTYQNPPDLPDFGAAVSSDFVKNFAKKAKESRDKKNRSTSAKAKERNAKRTRERLLKAGFTKDQVDRIMEIKRKTNDIWRQMMELWERFFSKDVEVIKALGGSYFSGKFSERRLLKNIAAVLANPGEARVHERRIVVEKKENRKPKKISLIFLIDMSGSMTKEQREAMQEAVYAIYNSYIQFQKNQIIENGFLHTKGYVRVIGYGSKAEDLFPLNDQEISKREVDSLDEDLERRFLLALFGIEKDLGSTNNVSALEIALEEAEKAQNALENDEEIMIVMEVTDGDPDNDNAARAEQLVTELNNKKNVYARGIRFGGNSDAFENIYGENGRPLDKIEQLKEVFISILAEAFTDVLI